MTQKIDCKQTLSSKIRGEERKTSKRMCVTVSMACERQYLKLLVALASKDG